MSDKRKPTLTLLDGARALDLDALAAMFTAITGREPTADELAEARAILAGERNDEIDREA